MICRARAGGFVQPTRPTSTSSHASVRVVQIDRRNLDAVFPSLLDAVHRAEFVGVDAELSGIGRAAERRSKVILH